MDKKLNDVYFKYRTEAIESKMECKLYKDLLKSLLSYMVFGDKNTVKVEGMNKKVYDLYKSLKNDSNLSSIALNELLLRDKSKKELMSIRNKINERLKND